MIPHYDVSFTVSLKGTDYEAMVNVNNKSDRRDILCFG